MTLAVPLSPQAESRLKERASAAGVDLPTYAAQLLERQLMQGDALAEISGSAAKEFAKTGMTEQQLADELEREDHASRGIGYDE